ncbi:MAG: hypothetical protein ACLSVD_03845 [Eggerthellaceae bacterium]
MRSVIYHEVGEDGAASIAPCASPRTIIAHWREEADGDRITIGVACGYVCRHPSSLEGNRIRSA